MENLMVIALVIAVFGGIWLLNKARDAAASGVNRALHKKEHEKGQELARQVVQVTAPPMPSGDVLDAIRKELNVFDQAPVVGQKAYATRVDENTLRVAFGNKLFTGWTVGILTHDKGDQGVDVLATWIEGTEVDGVMPGARELGLTYDRVRSAVEKLRARHQAGDAS